MGKENWVSFGGIALVMKFMYDLIARYPRDLSFPGPLGLFEKVLGKRFVIVFMWIVSILMLVALIYSLVAR